MELYHTFDESDLQNNGSGAKIRWLVMLRSDLIDGDRDNFVYTVTHELAHVLLEHNSAKAESGPQNEIEADQLVVKWGFEKELKAAPDNYLYGDGEWRKRVRENFEKGTKAKGE